MISLSSPDQMLSAVRTARDVTLSAYFLRPGSALTKALEDAAERGARVTVRVDGNQYGGSAANAPGNRKAVTELRGAGVDAQIVHRTDADGPPLHMKAAVSDGVAFLDDCNWNARDTIVKDGNHRHARAIREAALARHAGPLGSLALTKSDALAREANLLQKVREGRVDLETERIGSTPVSGALRALAKAHVRCRVLVSEWAFKDNRAAIQSLAGAGVDIRVAKFSEKFAVAPHSRVWIGSANATSTYKCRDQIEWSECAVSRSLARELEARFRARWDAASKVRVS